MHITHTQQGRVEHTIRIRQYWEDAGTIRQDIPAGATISRERDYHGSGDYMLVIHYTTVVE